MKLLVAIANYGSKNDCYLARVIDEYRRMPYETDIIVLSNVHKDLGPGVEVIAGLPSRDPWSLPFGHKRLFFDRRNAYDLFIYSEDDILITARNIDAYLRVTELLPQDQIAGLFRYEVCPDGNLFFPDVRDHFHWRPEIARIGEYTFGRFTNEHSGCYILTKAQLDHAIASGGFLVEPHQGRYDLLVSAATDPYTQCAYKKVLCLSHLEDFLIHHLPNKYLHTRQGVDAQDLWRQVDVLLRSDNEWLTKTCLLEPETNLFHYYWSKDLYEESRADLVDLLPPNARSVLSIGCGLGATEALLKEKGLRVVAVPSDGILGSCVQARGLEVIVGDLKTALVRLAGRQFDVVVMCNILHLLPDPSDGIQRACRLLSEGGTLIANVPNVERLPFLWQRLRHPSRYRHIGNHKISGMHLVGRQRTKKWLRTSGLRIETVADHVPARWQRGGKLTASLFSTDFTIVGRKPKAQPAAQRGAA